jgi:hypothetical protein
MMEGGAAAIENDAPVAAREAELVDGDGDASLAEAEEAAAADDAMGDATGGEIDHEVAEDTEGLAGMVLDEAAEDRAERVPASLGSLNAGGAALVPHGRWSPADRGREAVHWSGPRS